MKKTYNPCSRIYTHTSEFKKQIKGENTRVEKNSGITLIALVVTIIVLIILATISINVVFSENGIIRKAQLAKDIQANATKAEEEVMDTLLDGYTNMMGSLPTSPEEYKDNTLPTSPKVAEGMTKVKYNSTTGKWEKVTKIDEEWYDYAKKEWANVVLGDATFNEDGTLDESKPYSQLVWIPRYAYKITSQYHQEGTGAGNIEVAFIDGSNKGKDGTEYSTTYPSATNGGGMSDFVVHPAFDYDGKHLAGFWIGKFESSNTNCTTSAATGNASYTGSEVMTVKANVTSWRNISISDSFTTCLNMNKANNPYKLSTDDNVVDPHMVKNSEWGACSYLSKSKYGKEKEEVFINNSSDYITGNAGNTANAAGAAGVTNAYHTVNGMKASTTGNITGVYDMSGGNWERVAAYVPNGHENLGKYGNDLINGQIKYKDVYQAAKQWTEASSDTASEHYAIATPTNKKYGDAVWETSSKSEDPWEYSWYSDYSVFPYSNGPFFIRSGCCIDTSIAGAFCFSWASGNPGVNDGFRVVVPVL